MIVYDSDKVLNLKMLSGVDGAKEELVKRQVKLDTGLLGTKEERIVYVLNDEIKKQIKVIDSLYKKLPLLSYVSREKLLIEGYYSTFISGARTTIEDVKEVLNTNKRDADAKVVIDSFKSLQSVICEPVNKRDLVELWKGVMGSDYSSGYTNENSYRSSAKYVGGLNEYIHVPEKPENISSRIDSLYAFLLLGDMGKLLKSIALHFYILYVQPFSDGNGRVARILMAQNMYDDGYHKTANVSISKIIIENLTGYYKSLEESEVSVEGKIDITPFIVFMLNSIEKGIIDTLL